MKPSLSWKTFVFVFVGYFILGRTSLYFATMATTVSPVWPATGFSVFCMLIWGIRIWPAIYASAALVDYSAGTPLATSLAMAVGNFVEPMVAVIIINKISPASVLEASHRRTLAILIGVSAGALVAAGIGNAALFYWGFIGLEVISNSYLTWWTGDLIGAIFFTPIFIVFYNLLKNRKEIQSRADSFPMMRVFLILAAVCSVNYFLYFTGNGHYFIFAEFYLALCFFWLLPSCWAYLFSILVYGLSIYANIHQLGPFHNGNSNEGLLHTQLFFAGFLVTIGSLEVFALQRSKYWPFVVLASGWVVASGIYIGFVRSEEANEHEKFMAMSKEIAAGIESNLSIYESILGAARGFVQAHSSMDNQSWKVFASELSLEERFRGINGIGFVEWVPYIDIKSWESKKRQQNPEFKVHDVPGFPTENSEDRIIISAVEPLVRNKAALGLILSTEPLRREPLYRSLETKSASLSQPIQLVQDNQKRPGFLYILPAYRAGEFVGWAYAPFIADRVFKVSLAKYDRQIDYAVFFDNSSDMKSLLIGDGSLQKKSDLDFVHKFADAHFHIYFKKGSEFKSRQNVTAAWTSMVTSLIVLLFALIIGNFQSLNEEANRIAEEKTQALKDNEVLLVTSAKFTALGEMAGGIAHEINNPLAIIKGLATQIERTLGGNEEHAPLLKEKIKKISQTVDRISEIIVGLRSFSRSGESDSNAEFSVNETIQQTLSFCEQRFYNGGVRLDIEFDSNEKVFGNSIQLSQVILNLLNNAFDAIQDSSEKWIKIQTKLSQGFVQIRVTDCGLGISDEVAKKIMQPFFTTKPIGKGTGLGLSISKGIVEAHQGTLRIDSNNKNTCFVISLPILGKKGQV